LPKAETERGEDLGIKAAVVSTKHSIGKKGKNESVSIYLALSRAKVSQAVSMTFACVREGGIFCNFSSPVV
jgi:hypothetical protein